MKIFLSCSFDEERDKKVAEQLREFISKTIPGFILKKKRPAVDIPWLEIKRTINKCQGAIVILTKHARAFVPVKDEYVYIGKSIDFNQKDENEWKDDEWRTKGWLLTEAAYCLGQNKNVAIFREQGVKQLGIFEAPEYQPFSRDKNGNLKLNKKDTAHYLKSVFQPYTEDHDNYYISSRESSVSIKKDGFSESGDIFKACIVPDKKENIIKHEFSLPRDYKNKFSFNEMMDNHNKEIRTDNPSFFCRLIDSNVSSGKVTMTPESCKNSTNQQTKNFRLVFSPKLTSGDSVVYAWGWTCPQSYVITKEHAKERKNGFPKEICGIIKGFDDYFAVESNRPTSRLLLKVYFEEGYPLLGVPEIRITNSQGSLIDDHKIKGANTFPRKVNEPNGVEFQKEWEDGQVKQHVTYFVCWKIKNSKRSNNLTKSK
ncbi:hypothetical protein KAR28_02635 [Candidatus Parcubacteria bacterium]|nr:hypothetical protein [Candidatus Parcubacteria bacterium]